MRIAQIFAILAALITGAWMMPKETIAQSSANYQVFYDGLSPYGNWVDYPNYGYVWIPDAGSGFTPYATAGHWVYTDDGWTWVSDYPWGWAPFHYGRWKYDDNVGWLWVPGNEWAPAWVSWRRSRGYYGWAPLDPGISITVAFGNGYREPNDHWTFVGEGDISRPDISNHYIDRSRNITIINQSTLIVNVHNDAGRNGSYIAGPDRNEVQKFTHSPVKTVAIQDNSNPGQHLNSGALQIYRPQVQKVSKNGKSPAPSKVMKLSDVKPVLQKNAGNQNKSVTPTNNKNKQPQNTAPTQNKSKQTQNVAPTQNRSKQTQNVAPTQNRSRQTQNVAPPKNNPVKQNEKKPDDKK